MKATPGLHSPAELVEAEMNIIRAKRERAGGLNNDADASYLDALITLGGSPSAAATRPACLKQPCNMVN